MKTIGKVKAMLTIELNQKIQILIQRNKFQLTTNIPIILVLILMISIIFYYNWNINFRFI